MTVIKLRNKKKTRVCFLFEFIQQKDGKLEKIGFFRSLDTRDLPVAGVQAGAPGKSS